MGAGGQVSELGRRSCGATLPPRRVRVRDVVDGLGNHCFGSVLLVLAVPVVLPIPLGLSAVFAVPILVYTGRIMIGAPAHRLPAWVDRQGVRTGLACAMIDRIVPRLRTIEAYLRPRWPLLAGAAAEPPLALACFLLAIVAVIPLPLTGWLPAFAILVIGLGLIHRDGLAVALGLALGAVAVAVLLAVVFTLMQAGRWLLASDLAPS